MWKSSLLFFLSIAAAHAATYTVNPSTSSGADYTDLQLAIDNASAGDTLLLAPGTYSNGDNNPFIIGKPLTLIGSGYSRNLNYPDDKQPLATTYIEDFIIIQDTASGVSLISLKSWGLQSDASFTAKRCWFVDHFHLSSQANGGNSYIDQCFFGNPSSPDFPLDTYADFSASAFIRNSIVLAYVIIDSSDSDISVTFENSLIYRVDHYSDSYSATVSTASFNKCIFLYDLVESNTIGSITTNYCAYPAGGAFIDNGQSNVAFADLTPDGGAPYFLETGSYDSRWQFSDQALGDMAIGSTGELIGPFAGDDPYILSGLPAMPQATAVEVPAFVSESTGLPIKVTITASP